MMRNTIAVLALSAAFLFAASGPVPYYGTLSVNGNKIVGKNTGNDKAVQLRGISLYWSCPGWESNTNNYWSKAGVDAMVDVFKVDVVRAAMAADISDKQGNDITSSTGNSSCKYPYTFDKTTQTNLVKTVVNQAIARDIYVIVDWHAHHANNYENDVIDFFTKQMKDYHNKPNVIFEIFNEPLTQTWSTVKSFADRVTKAIRDAGANNLVLIGTPTWSQDVNLCGNSQPNDKNTACVFHFYAAEHTLANFRSKVETALKNRPVFVSEYGTMKPDGDSPPNTANTDAWHKFMDENNISSCIWAFSSHGQTSAIYSSFPGSNWSNESNMTANGKYILGKLKGYAADEKTAEWRFREATPVSSRPIALHNISVASNRVMLQVSAAAVVQIFDLRGSLVRKVAVGAGSHVVSLNDLSKGLYIAKIVVNNQMQVVNVPIR